MQRLNVPKPVRLSQAALETLAIISYKQPCIRSEVEDVRGVDTGGVLKTLIERSLVRIVGRRDEAGQPLLYGTTPTFLEVFDLNDLRELPSLKEIKEMMEKKQVMTDEADASQKIMQSNEDEPTEAVEEDGDEPTEVIEYDEDPEQDEIDDLEHKLKSLRSIEKEIFSSPMLKKGGTGDSNIPPEVTAQEEAEQQAVQGEGESEPVEGNPASAEDETKPTDSSV